MANLCSNHLYISGPKETVSALKNKIEAQDEDLLAMFCWFTYNGSSDYGMYQDTYTPEPESISFSFGSKWNFPEYEFRNLVEAYPDLEFEGDYEEPAMEVFGKVTGKNGVSTITYVKPLDYYTENNEDFAAEREYLENAPYDKFLKHVLDTSYNGEDDEDSFYLLEQLIVNRIEDKDLPLFVNYKWYNESYYKERLKNGKDD